jgi:hypothetical protein
MKKCMAKSLEERLKEAQAEMLLVSAAENTRQQAEIAFILASLYREAGSLDQARVYASRSIALFERAGVDTFDDALTGYYEFAGVFVPDLIHEDVVRQNFAEFNL